MISIYKRRKQNRKNSCHIVSEKLGTTIVELVVTFALIAIFAAGTCQVIANAIKVYHRMQGLNYAKQVEDTLMDKITGEIEGAQTSMAIMKYDENGELVTDVDDDDKMTLYIYNNNHIIDLVDRTGSHIAMTTTLNKTNIANWEPSQTFYTPEKDGSRLLICYDQVTSKTEDSNGNEVSTQRYQAVDWLLDKSAYMGFEIKTLTFSLAGTEYPENVIRVDLTLKSDKFGEFSAYRYVSCFNFITEEDFNKIGADEGSGGEPGGGEPGGGEPGGGEPGGGEPGGGEPGGEPSVDGFNVDQIKGNQPQVVLDFFSSGWTEKTEKVNQAITTYKYKSFNINGTTYYLIFVGSNIKSEAVDALKEQYGSNTIVAESGKLSNEDDRDIVTDYLHTQDLSFDKLGSVKFNNDKIISIE